jgi:hypothetical protein
MLHEPKRFDINHLTLVIREFNFEVQQIVV